MAWRLCANAIGVADMNLFRNAAAGLLAAWLTLLPLGAQAQNNKPFRVVTTFTVIQDIAQNVAGDRAIVESITKPGAEIHDYQPTPLDIVRAQAADLVLWNGFNLERSEEHTSELQSRLHLVCRLLLEK